MYELGTGRQAFTSDEAIRHYAWSGKGLQNISAVRAGLGKEIESIVTRMINVLPEMRPSATNVLREVAVIIR